MVDRKLGIETRIEVALKADTNAAARRDIASYESAGLGGTYIQPSRAGLDINSGKAASELCFERGRTPELS